jgi:hypothetical protein
MRRFSWLLILLIMLKLSLGSAAAMPLSALFNGSTEAALPACHTSMAQPLSLAEHQDPHAEQPRTEVATEHATLPSPDAGCKDCQLCCAFGLNLFSVSLPQAASASHPQGLTLRWNSVSLRPELRPPLL